ncbi:MAG: hypothetical protein PHV59_08355, partial [Victivallales bacterium]|nr:hypothetical protein [Victivallales bacterium]
MRIFKSRITENRKRERGIALIFTLIMLSLLLILALAFALDSMFDQKAAYNSASSSSADSLIQSQLQEILALVRNDEANFSSATWSRDINYDYTAAALDTHTDMLAGLLEITGVLDDNNNKTARDSANWNYIKDEADNDRIVGRTAFVIIPEEKIPLPSMVDEREGTTEYPKISEE